MADTVSLGSSVLGYAISVTKAHLGILRLSETFLAELDFDMETITRKVHFPRYACSTGMILLDL